MYPPQIEAHLHKQRLQKEKITIKEWFLIHVIGIALMLLMIMISYYIFIRK